MELRPIHAAVFVKSAAKTFSYLALPRLTSYA